MTVSIPTCTDTRSSPARARGRARADRGRTRLGRARRRPRGGHRRPRRHRQDPARPGHSRAREGARFRTAAGGRRRARRRDGLGRRPADGRAVRFAVQRRDPRQDPRRAVRCGTDRAGHCGRRPVRRRTGPHAARAVVGGRRPLVDAAAADHGRRRALGRPVLAAVPRLPVAPHRRPADRAGGGDPPACGEHRPAGSAQRVPPSRADAAAATDRGSARRAHRARRRDRGDRRARGEWWKPFPGKGSRRRTRGTRVAAGRRDDDRSRRQTRAQHHFPRRDGPATRRSHPSGARPPCSAQAATRGSPPPSSA